jgi:hydroxypyruvate isomerase
MSSPSDNQTSSHRFHLRYAARLDKFPNLAGPDHFDQLRFIADQGFAALEDSYMQRRTVEFQERLAREIDRLGLAMGTFVGVTDLEQPSFTSGREDFRADVLARLRGAVETARRLRAAWFTVIPGTISPGIPLGFQTANVIDLLRRCCDLCEPAGMTMVIEPLNPWVDHPGMFLTTMSQGYALCKAVGSPRCKLLADIYHQQITEGNILPTLERAWDEIAYVQVGDHPGRCEPGSGEINYKNVFRFLRRQGYGGLVGMEHGQSIPGREGELAVLAAYRAVDPADE